MNPKWLSWVFGLLGVGVLCPWNAFINARPYFESRFCGLGTNSTKSDNHNNIEVWFSLVYNVGSVLSLTVLLSWQYHRDEINPEDVDIITFLLPEWMQRLMGSMAKQKKSITTTNSNFKTTTTMISLAVYFVVFLFTTIIVIIPSIPAIVVWIWTLIGLFLCGVCTSIACAGIVGTAALLDGTDVGVVGPFFQGQAMGGLFVAFANLMAAIENNPNQFRLEICGQRTSDGDMSIHDKEDESVKLMPSSPLCVTYDTIDWSTMGYFLLGTLSIAACMIGYHQVEQYRDRRANYTEITCDHEIVPKVESLPPMWKRGMEKQGQDGEETCTRESSFLDSFEDDACMPAQNFIQLSLIGDQWRQASDIDPSSLSDYTVWSKQKWLASSLFITYTITLAIFPALTSDLASVHRCQSQNRLFDDLFVPLTFLVFNVGDLLGRFFVKNSTADQMPGLDRMLFWGSLARFVFLQLFLFCYSATWPLSKMAVKSDLFSWTVQFLFAFSNGIITSLCFSHAPSLVPFTEKEQQESSAILNLSLCSGLLLGSCLSFPLLWTLS